MGLLTFKGGVHPNDGKSLAKDKACLLYTSLSAVILAEYGIALKKINMRSIGWTGWKIVLLQLFFVRGTMRILTGFTAIL